MQPEELTESEAWRDQLAQERATFQREREEWRSQLVAERVGWQDQLTAAVTAMVLPLVQQAMSTALAEFRAELQAALTTTKRQRQLPASPSTPETPKAESSSSSSRAPLGRPTKSPAHKKTAGDVAGGSDMTS
jgi:hypothetical protein